jgi:hypothetical protein
MRFEPPEFNTPDNDRKEMPLFRITVSHRPGLLYLFLVTVFYCAFLIARAKVAGSDPYAPILTVFLAGWLVFLTLFLLSGLMFIYTRLEVTTRMIRGRKLTWPSRHVEIPLRDISTVKLSQYFFAGPLHYGRITLKTGRKRYYFFWVREAVEVKAALERAVAKAKKDELGGVLPKL